MKLYIYIVLISALVAFVYAPDTHDLAMHNMKGQFIIFLVCASLPCAYTGRMSYVDIAWPYGLCFIGYQLFSMNTPRHTLIGIMYMLSGGRMSLGATLMLAAGRFKREFKRYQYQKRRWERAGNMNHALSMQQDLWMQAAANCTCLFAPGAVIRSYGSESSLHWLEWCGVIGWCVFFTLEAIADYQKDAFVRKAKPRKAVCNVGLWSIVRHPNYFCEWMVWNSMLVMALPSLYTMLMESSQPPWVSVCMCVSVVSVCGAMYECLVNWTGARPAEYYSMQSRPGYKEYAAKTPQFFPRLCS